MARTEVRGGQILDASVSLTADITGTLPVANGGTGAATLASNNVLLGNGTSALQTVAPSTSGNVLTSNGTTWTSATQTGGGDVTQTGTQTLTNKSVSGLTNSISNVTSRLVPVRVVAEGSGLTFTISSGSVTQINGTTIDGVSTLAIGDRIAVTGAPSATGVGSVNSAQPGNGVYTITGTTTNITVTRAADMSGTVIPWGLWVYVIEGSWTLFDIGWTGTGAFTWGTTALQGYNRWASTPIDAASTTTLTNKRVTKRVVSPSVAGTYTVDWTNCDSYVISTQNAAITNLTATGTATDEQLLMIRIKGDATPRAITWDSAKYVSSGVATLLATTAASKTHRVGLVYDGILGKMVCIAVDATGY